MDDNSQQPAQDLTAGQVQPVAPAVVPAAEPPQSVSEPDPVPAVQPDPQPEPVIESKPDATPEPLPEADTSELAGDDVDEGTTVEEEPLPEQPFSWQASEFIHHQKQGTWYGIFAIVVIILIGVAVVTKQWFSVAVFIAMAGALMVYARKEPRTLRYQIDEHGLLVENKLYKYDHFRSFSLFNDVAWHSIDLDPTQRFVPRLTVIFESKDLDSILGILSSHLPRIDRQPDLVERLTRTLKF